MTTPDELDPITGEAALDPTLLDEREPVPEEFPAIDPELLPDGPLPDEAFLEPAPTAAAPPPLGQPEADRGTSDGSLVCTVCLQRVGAGETYTKTPVRGITHLEPCSHRA